MNPASRILVLAVIAVLATGCATLAKCHRDDNPLYGVAPTAVASYELATTVVCLIRESVTTAPEEIQVAHCPKATLRDEETGRTYCAPDEPAEATK